MANVKAVRKVVENLLVAQTDEQKADLGVERLDPIPDDLAAPVLEAFRHYATVAEDSDFAINVYRTPSKSGPIIVVVMSPDGGDGTFEAFLSDGTLVGAGQFLQQKVAWAKPSKVRKLRAAEFLPELQPALSWVEQPNGDQHSTCNRFHIRQNAKGWELVQLQATFPTLTEAQAMADHIAPFYEE